ncbi:hypothetical protein C1646_766276 [Rhizophagus diaphanus]|nr:hypothetical protein C1646_766276 [Rhizophagus diaphanus] [Rhizophagus sp. MUCL 43196]
MAIDEVIDKVVVMVMIIVVVVVIYYQPIESSVSSTQVLKTIADHHDSEKQPSKLDLNVISIFDDELGSAFDNTINDFSISGLFKLNYSTIMDNSEKICEDDHKIETKCVLYMKLKLVNFYL